jgi:hypothetical protein
LAAIVTRLEPARAPIDQRGDAVEVRGLAGNRLLLTTAATCLGVVPTGLVHW